MPCVNCPLAMGKNAHGAGRDTSWERNHEIHEAHEREERSEGHKYQPFIPMTVCPLTLRFVSFVYFVVKKLHRTILSFCSSGEI